ncbi:MAG: NERD domain-containing protein [Bacteroidales bacterium]|nr:NERD domain-containing protein [Bacteroidales bacterium]
MHIFIFIISICGFITLIIWGIKMSSPTYIGKYGEKRVAHKLNWLPKEYITLNDILLPTTYGTSQIDHIVVSPYGIFIIETKNYKGWIFGHEKSENWKQSLLGKKTFWGWSSEQYNFKNPIHQNRAHSNAVKAILADIGDFKIIPMVVFSNRAELNITTPNHIVINWNHLRSTIKEFDVLTILDVDIQKIVERLTSSNITSEDSRSKHIQNIQTNIKRTHLAIANNQCPKCGGTLIERNGRFGSFLGCSNYPKCKFTHNK